MELLKKKFRIKSRANLLNPPSNNESQVSPFKNFTFRALSLSSPKLPKVSSNINLNQLSPINLKKLISSPSPKNLEKNDSRPGTLYRKKSKNWYSIEKVKKHEHNSHTKNDQFSIELKDFRMGSSFAKIGVIGKKFTRKSYKLPFISKKNEGQSGERKNEALIGFAEYNEPFIRQVLEKKQKNQVID